jgi:hypothetical protein
MKESIQLPEILLLKRLRNERESLNLDELNVDLLTVQSASQDVNLAREAKLKLMEKWDVLPEFDAKNTKTINLLEQFETFSESEREIILSQLVGIQLTEGCNGHCSFCLFGSSKGVESKYSFESIKSFFEKYRRYFKDSPTLYWASDPFDYRDGEYSFVDVYKFLREQGLSGGLSTAMPKGGEDDFIKFMLNMFETESEEHIFLPEMRLSVGKHNIQRVESTIKKLTDKLSNNGFVDSNIDSMYRKYLTVAWRKNFYKLGARIKEHDDIKDFVTPACSDGVIISPKNVRAIMVTTPTIYEPSGEKSIVLEPGNVNVPVYYSVVNWPKKLEARSAISLFMRNKIETPSEEEYCLVDGIEDIVLKLGRETSSIGYLIQDLASIDVDDDSLFSESIDHKEEFLKLAMESFKERRKYTKEKLGVAKNLLASGTLSDEDFEKVDFYKTLTEVYLTEMDFLASQVEQGQFIRVIVGMANIFRDIGRDNVADLPKIIERMVNNTTY